MEEHQKNCMGVALNFLTQYKEDGNDLLEQIITSAESQIHFYELERKSASMVWKKRGKSAVKIQEWQAMLIAFWIAAAWFMLNLVLMLVKKSKMSCKTLISIL